MIDFNFSLASIFSVFIPLLMLFISIYHITRKMTLESVLLLIGSTLSFMTSIIFIFIPYYVASHYLSMESATMYYSANGILTFFGHLLFALAFLLLVIRSHKSEKIVQNY